MDRGIELVIFPVTHPAPPFDWQTPDELERRFGEPRQGRGRRPHARSGFDGAGATEDRVVLHLYVSPDSASCAKAVVALQQMLAMFPPRAFTVRIVDVSTDIALAEQHQVLFTPTLMMQDRDGRATRVLGDLSSADLLVDLLRGRGLEPV
jgi:hypothetical protein